MNTSDRDKEAIRSWMLYVMEQRDWSARHWATLAKTSPTNITRFLNRSDSIHIPSTKTIQLLARAAGIWPTLQQDQPRVLTPGEVKKMFLSTENGDNPAEGTHPPPKDAGVQYIVMLQTNTLAHLGIHSGDFITFTGFDPNTIKPGDIVIYFDDDLLSGALWTKDFQHEAIGKAVSLTRSL